ncbi:MAG: cyclopropane-fatty-acyl-phospholipid synthase family protein [Bacteroidia bacterium]
MKNEVSVHPEVIKYYNECWLNRFEKGHNPLSLAMHLGYFSEDDIDNDKAKLNSNEFLSAHIGIPSDKEIRIADFGCGVGGTCIYFAQKFPQAKISGINISSDQIDFANKAKNQKNINGQIEYFISDYSATQLESATFDFVIGIESLCHAADKLSVYKEAYRVLKPKGVFSFMDYFETNIPDNHYDDNLLQDFRKGWAVVEYNKNYKTFLTQAGYSEISSISILESVIPGINHSYKTAINKINSVKFDSYSTYIQNHLKACVALKELVDKKIIDYRVITAQK